LVPETQWGARMAAAYRKTWQDLAGDVVAEMHYGREGEPYSEAVIRALNIDLSTARFRNVQRLTGTELEFEPRRREDIDVILLAALAQDAKQILPQLRYFRAQSIPVYSTSHSYQGRPGKNRENDLDGIVFSDMPWLFDLQDKELFATVKTSWPETSSKYIRFYGLGIDAYRLVFNLGDLRAVRGSRIAGATGSLWLDHTNTIRRDMTWVKVIDGYPRILNDENSNTHPSSWGDELHHRLLHN